MKFSWKNAAEPVLFFLALLVLWEILVEVIQVPAFILPPPRDLWTAFFKKLPILGHHALITFIEAFGGFVLSVTGAIVAEFVAANEGLGYLVLQANYSLDTAFALVILLILAVLSLVLFWLAEFCQRKLAPWSAAVREVEGSF